MNLLTLINSIQELINLLIPLIIGLALVGLLWGLTMYIFKAGDEKAQGEGKKVMFWGVIALFVMVSVWGIVGVLQESLFDGADITQPPEIPALPGGSPGGGGGNGGCPAGGCGETSV
jgi:uncharacterized membrane-anchored protein